MIENSRGDSRYAFLDGWRGLSILMVLVGHFVPVANINLGRFGVEMFFVLSGRLMGEILFEKKSSLPRFFKRRISRVWPALFFFIAVVGFVSSNLNDSYRVSPAVILSCIAFGYNYLSLSSLVGSSPLVDHIWSLCVEEHMYLLLGVVAYFSRRFSFNPIRIIIIIYGLMILNGVIGSFVFHLKYDANFWRSDVRGASILIGVILYFLPPNNSLLYKTNPLFLFLLAVFLNAAVVPDAIKYSFGTLLLALSLNSVQVGGIKSFRTFLEYRYLGWIGGISFSLYLWQQPFYKFIGSLNAFMLIALTFAVAIANYYIVEVSTRSYLNRTWAN